MTKWLRFTIVVVCCLFVIFMLYPTGSNASDVLVGYASTLSITTSDTLPWTYYSEAKAVTSATDPLLEDIQSTTGGVDGMCPYLWVRADRVTPVTLKETIVSSTFPLRRNGTPHNGTDYTCSVKNEGITYQVALWEGTVVTAQFNKSYGNYVVIDHGHGFYTLYAHMGFGRASSSGGAPLAWESAAKQVIGNNTSSLLVKVGDHVVAGQPLGTLGTTGNSTGPHAHIELQLRGGSGGLPYRAGLTDILLGKKSFAELKWYKGSRDAGFGSATDLQDAANDKGLDASGIAQLANGGSNQ